MIRLAILAALLLTTACSANDGTDPPEREGFASNGRRSLAATDADIGGAKGGQSYIGYAVARDHRGSGRAYADYGCATDCSDIRAGYQDAKTRRVTNARLCTGATWGELEGCVAFTQGMAPQMTQLPPLGDE